MGYFSNGCEGADYQTRYCERCVNYRDLHDGRGVGCPIWDAHLCYCSDAIHGSNAANLIGQDETVIQVGDGENKVVGNVHYQQRWTVNLRAASGILNMLIPRSKCGCGNEQCTMFQATAGVTV